MLEGEEGIALGAFITATIPMLILANFARWSLMAVALLLAAQLLVGIPFSPLWGFMMVPLGAVVSIYAGYKLSS
jgi:hypothetical protein